MVTTVGTENKLEDLLADLVRLEHDAVDAYDAAIERLVNAGWRSSLIEFRRDHLRHIEELGEALSAMGRDPPKDGDMKSFLTQGKVVVAGLIGDTAILQAMKTNEDDTNKAYERGVQHRDASLSLRAVLQRALADERRHRGWMIEQIERA